MASLQHNKTIVVDGPSLEAVVCGSTNFSWRGFFVQANNAVVLHGSGTCAGRSWRRSTATGSTTMPKGSAQPPPPIRTISNSAGIDARVAFSPHAADNALLKAIADRHRHRDRSRR